MDEKTKRILEIYSKMTLEQIFELESRLSEEEKIMTKKIPVPELVYRGEVHKT